MLKVFTLTRIDKPRSLKIYTINVSISSYFLFAQHYVAQKIIWQSRLRVL